MMMMVEVEAGVCVCLCVYVELSKRRSFGYMLFDGVGTVLLSLSVRVQGVGGW